MLNQMVPILAKILMCQDLRVRESFILEDDLEDGPDNILVSKMLNVLRKLDEEKLKC